MDLVTPGLRDLARVAGEEAEEVATLTPESLEELVLVTEREQERAPATTLQEAVSTTTDTEGQLSTSSTAPHPGPVASTLRPSKSASWFVFSDLDFFFLSFFFLCVFCSTTSPGETARSSDFDFFVFLALAWAAGGSRKSSRLMLPSALWGSDPSSVSVRSRSETEAPSGTSTEQDTNTFGPLASSLSELASFLAFFLFFFLLASLVSGSPRL